MEQPSRLDTLRQSLIHDASDVELRALGADLGLHPAQLSGSTHAERANALVDLMTADGQLLALENHVLILRTKKLEEALSHERALAQSRHLADRAQALANRIEQGANTLADFADGLTDAEWHTLVPSDNRTVGVLVHHVASLYPLEIDLAQGMAASKPITGVTSDAVAQMNAQHAHDYASIGKQEAIALLRQNSKAAAERVRQFTDAQLDAAVPVSLNADAPLTAQFFIEDHALRHSFHHLANIRAALKR